MNHSPLRHLAQPTNDLMYLAGFFVAPKTERKEQREQAVKLSPSLLMEHTRRAILADGVHQVVAYGNTGDTWIVDVTAGHMTAQKLQQLRAVATVDVQDMGRITRLVLAF